MHTATAHSNHAASPFFHTPPSKPLPTPPSNPPYHSNPTPVTPEAVYDQIMNIANYLGGVAQTFGLTIRELAAYMDTPEFQQHVQFVLSVDRLRQQMLASQEGAETLMVLVELMHCGKPEVARRAANTMLTIAGLLPSPTPAKKPWESPPETALTKQHMPTYNDSPIKPGTAACQGQETPTPPEPPLPTFPLSPAHLSPAPPPPTPQDNSAFSIHNSALKSNLTKQHTLTYNQSTPQSLAHSALQQAILQAASQTPPMMGGG